MFGMSEIDLRTYRAEFWHFGLNKRRFEQIQV